MATPESLSHTVITKMVPDDVITHQEGSVRNEVCLGYRHLSRMAFTGRGTLVLAAVFVCFIALAVHVKADDEPDQIVYTTPEDVVQKIKDIAGDGVLADKDAEEGGDDDDDDDDDDSSDVEEENGVLVLTDENFDDVVNSKENILVEFYAPWCGHCKSLAPKYEEAAKELKENDPPIPLAKVDATVHSAVAGRFEVQGYPTLKFFKNGSPHEYDGGREKDDIVQFMKAKADPNWKPPPSSVLTLTKDNFDETVNNADLILVEFYAPWCGHCKQLAPKYEKAAKTLEKDNIPLAKVDATEESELAQKYGVSGYPTMKMFRKGKVYDYNGPREEWGIVDYMKKQSGDASKELKDLKAIKQYLNEKDVTVLAFFDGPEDKAFELYNDAANEVREDFKLGHSFDASVRDQYKVNAGSLIVINAEKFNTKYEPKWHVMDKLGDASAADVAKFMKDHQVPLVGHYDYDSKQKRYETRPLCLFFYTVDWSFDHREATQLWRRKIAGIAKDYPGIKFAVADEDGNQDLMKDFGFDESAEDMNIGCLGEKDKKYPMEAMEEWESDDIKEFLDKFQKGEIPALVKSQPAPKKQKGPVKVVVGKTFENIVLDSKKDVLIELYAPWCGHCKQLEPKYKQLAKKLKGEKNLVIAKMDATANDAPEEFSSSGYPTIYFAPANNKKNPVKFEGSREVEDFEKFLKEHATVSFGKSVKDEL